MGGYNKGYKCIKCGVRSNIIKKRQITREIKKGLYLFLGGIYNPILQLFNSNKLQECKNLIKLLKNEFDENFAFELQRINEVILDKFENQFINLAIA